MKFLRRIRTITARSFACMLLMLALPFFAHAFVIGTWTPAHDMNMARVRHTMTLLPSGKVLVTGDNSSASTAEIYDATANTWTPAASLNAGRALATASLLSSGKVLVTGGNLANNCSAFGTTTGISSTCYATATGEIYTPSGNVWNPAGSLTTARQGHSAIVLASGNVLVAGGVSDCTTVTDPNSQTSYCTYVMTAEIYSPTNNTWSSAGTLNVGRIGQTATLLLSGKVLLTGGSNSSGIVASAEIYDPATNVWTSVASMGSTRYGHSATLLPSGKVYIAGGSTYGVSSLATAEIYDPIANIWLPGASLTSARLEHTATVLSSGKILLTSGYGIGTESDLYDPTNDTIVSVSGLNTPRYLHTAVLLGNGKVMVAGGFSGDGELASTELFDSTNNSYTVTTMAGANGAITPDTQTVDGGVSVTVTVTPGYASSISAISGDTCSVTQTDSTTWTTNAIHADCKISVTFLGPMAANRFEFTATRLPSGKVLLAGGSSTPTADLYDPATQSISATGAMMATHYLHSATLLPSGKVLITGGFISDSSYTQITAAEIYDPATNTWSIAHAMPTARAGHVTVLLSTGKVLAIGSFYGGQTGTAELYDPGNDTWSVAAKPTYDRSQPTATALPSGKILIAGGYDTGTQLYNPTTNTWSAGGTVSFVVNSQSATALADGKVLIAGGQIDQQAIANTSIYDPTSNVWHDAKNMNVARDFHTATLLPSGKVAVIGGEINDPISYSATTATTEIYDPATNTRTASTSLTQPREDHTATLLSTGQILVAGGDGVGSVELFGAALPNEIFGNGFQ